MTAKQIENKFTEQISVNSGFVSLDSLKPILANISCELAQQSQYITQLDEDVRKANDIRNKILLVLVSAVAGALFKTFIDYLQNCSIS